MVRRSTISLEELRDKLRIDRHALDDEVEQQAELYQTIADLTVMAKSRRDQAENAVKEKQAELDVDIRRKASGKDEKVTEKEIASRIVTNSMYRKLVARALSAREEYERLEVMQISFRQRSYMLRDLVELHIAGYYQSRSVGTSEKRHTDKKAESITARMAESRQSQKRGARARSRLKKHPNAR